MKPFSVFKYQLICIFQVPAKEKRKCERQITDIYLDSKNTKAADDDMCDEAARENSNLDLKCVTVVEGVYETRGDPNTLNNRCEYVISIPH